jgi:integrase
MADLMRWRTDRDIANLPAPTDTANVRYPHATIKRLYMTVTRGGVRSPCMKYGRGTVYTFGVWPGWRAKHIEEEGARLTRLIDQGGDPAAERQAKRTAPTFNTVCDQLVSDHFPGLRESTRANYQHLISKHIRPWFGHAKVAEITQKDIAVRLRALAADHPYQSNRVQAVLSLLFRLAVKEGVRADNPVEGIRPAHEDKRETYLFPEQISRLVVALHAHPEKISAAAILFMLLTGCRRGEALGMVWNEADIDRATWAKPSTRTKQRQQHRVPLSSAAVGVLHLMWAEHERLRLACLIHRIAGIRRRVSREVLIVLTNWVLTPSESQAHRGHTRHARGYDRAVRIASRCGQESHRGIRWRTDHVRWRRHLAGAGRTTSGHL